MARNNRTYVCSKCFKDFGEMEHPGYFVLFDKCRGKTCPECGRVRKLEKVHCTYRESTKPGMEGRIWGKCGRCNRDSVCFFNGVCEDCFFKIQKEKNSCFCPLTKAKHDKSYYCSFCENYHGLYRGVLCKDCAKKYDEQSLRGQRKRAIFKIGLPSFIGGIIVGCFCSFLFWLLLVKLRRKTKYKQ